MLYLTLDRLLRTHRRVIAQSGGSAGVRDLGLVKSALAQPQMTFGGEDLYPTLVEKAAALGFSLINNHPFVDGNKRIGHAAIEAFLLLNGHEIDDPVDDQEQIILQVAAGELSRAAFGAWLQQHVVPKL